jgi:hypothetical protein
MTSKARRALATPIAALAIAALVCSGGSGRKTSDRQCDSVLVEILIDIPGGGAQWASMSQGEKRQLMQALPSNPGTRGEYLHQCVDEGWTGYYE